MLTSNPQLEGQVRTLVMFLGGLAIGRGLLTEHDLTTIVALIPVAFGAAGMVWSWWVNRPQALVQAAATLPVVETIKLDPRQSEAIEINKNTDTKVTMTETPPPTKKGQHP